MSGWDKLRALRNQGSLPKCVIVTDDPHMPLIEQGNLGILHDHSAPMPVSLLNGLNVIFWFKRCDYAAAVQALMIEQNVRLKTGAVWCHCAGQLNASPLPCERIEELCDW